MTALELTVPVLVAGGVHLAAWGIGASARDRLRRGAPPSDAPGEEALLGALVGFALMGALAFVLATAGLLRPPVLVAILASGAAAGVVRIARSRREGPRTLRWSDAPLVLVVVALALHLPAALYPFVDHDESVYHLLLPRLYLEAGGLVSLPFHFFANMPHQVDLLWAWPMAAGGFAAAKVTSLGFVFWTIGGVASFARRVAGPVAAGVAALLVVSGPNVLWHLSLTYVEPVLGAFLLGAVLALRRRDLVAVGLCCGTLMASKYTAWIPAAAVLVAAIVTARRALAAAVPVALAAALVLPWLVKNAVVTGNPIYPNAWGLLGGAHWSAIQATHLARLGEVPGGADKGPWSFVTLPLRLVFWPVSEFYCAQFSASLMALFLVGLLAPRSWRRETRLVPALAVAAFAGWALTVQQGRFLVASVPLMTLVAVLPLSAWRGRPAVLETLFAGIAAVAAAQAIAQPFARQPVLDVFTKPRRELLERNVFYEIAAYLNREVPADGRVLSLFEDRLYFLERPFVADTVWEAPTILAWLRETGDVDAFGRLLVAEGFTHVVLRSNGYLGYTQNRLAFDLIDPRVYPTEAFRKDKEMLDRFLDTWLEIAREDEVWPVFRIRPPAAPGPPR